MSHPRRRTSIEPAARAVTVCASVKVRLGQDAVLSREAFAATIEIANGSDATLTGAFVELLFTTEDGADATDQFATSTLELDQLSAIDGSGIIAAGMTGSAKWTVVPATNAAPEEAVVYYISGTLAYNDNGIDIRVIYQSPPVSIDFGIGIKLGCDTINIVITDITHSC